MPDKPNQESKITVGDLVKNATVQTILVSILIMVISYPYVSEAKGLFDTMIVFRDNKEMIDELNSGINLVKEQKEEIEKNQKELERIKDSMDSVRERQDIQEKRGERIEQKLDAILKSIQDKNSGS